MKKRAIKFSPDLSARKQLAIDRLGAGLIEKILIRYDTKWWGYKIGGADFFGSIPMAGSDSGVDAEDDQDHSGIFNVFYDIPSLGKKFENLGNITKIKLTFLALWRYYRLSFRWRRG
jgi:hypothetical protein